MAVRWPHHDTVRIASAPVQAHRTAPHRTTKAGLRLPENAGRYCIGAATPSDGKAAHCQCHGGDPGARCKLGPDKGPRCTCSRGYAGSLCEACGELPHALLGATRRSAGRTNISSAARLRAYATGRPPSARVFVFPIAGVRRLPRVPQGGPALPAPAGPRSNGRTCRPGACLLRSR